MALLATRLSPQLAAELEERHADLTELICDAANAGRAVPAQEASYQLQRRWFAEYLALLPTPGREVLEALLGAESLAALLASDDGWLMEALLYSQAWFERWKIPQG